MRLVQIQTIKFTHPLYKELDNLCFLSKNLYNATLYTVRQHYFQTQKYLTYNNVNKLFTDTQQPDYCSLPRKVSKFTQQLVDKNFKSFFSLLQKKKSNSYDKPINIPKYLHPVKGRQVVHYTKQALSFKEKGYVKLSGTDIKIKIPDVDVDFVRIVPKNMFINIEVGYQQECLKSVESTNYASIDLGVNNLATITSNVFSPLIINGKPLKSINQFYNKQLAYYNSYNSKDKQLFSKKIRLLHHKRNCKIKDYLHKSSKVITNQLVFNNISNLVIGYNKNWKQDVNLGKINNQKFVQIPFLQFIHMLKYKCELLGINVVLQEESYTSKCSFIDNENICKHFEYLGKRMFRGLFKTSTNYFINADVNGSYNILKKFLIKHEAWNEKIFSNLVEVCSTPLVFTIK